MYNNLIDVIPVKLVLEVLNRGAGTQMGKYWIPPYQVRGRLNQVRNDKL